MHYAIRLSIMCLLSHSLCRGINVCKNFTELHTCKMLRLCKKKTRFNKHTPKLWWKMQKQTGSSFYSPQKDPPKKPNSLHISSLLQKPPAWQKNKIIAFGLHYSFDLLKTSFSPLRSESTPQAGFNVLPKTSGVAGGDASAEAHPSGTPAAALTAHVRFLSPRT